MTRGGKIVRVVLLVLAIPALACGALLIWVRTTMVICHPNSDSAVLQMKKVSSDLDMYAAKHRGQYPSSAEGLAAASKYFPDNKVPTDAWGNDFQYFAPATTCQKAYELVSYGADGQQGGENQDADLSTCDPPGV